MTIYEIDHEIESCIDFETGEIVDIDKLNSLQIEKDRKIENIACWIKNLISDADAIKAEKENLADRETKLRKKAEQLKGYLAFVLNGEKFNAPRCEISWRRSEQVEIVDEALIPKKYLVIQSKPDKKAIKDAIKAGLKVKGCAIAEKNNISIK